MIDDRFVEAMCQLWPRKSIWLSELTRRLRWRARWRSSRVPGGQGRVRARFSARAFSQGRIRAETGGAANGGVLALNLSVENDLCGGIAADFFIGHDGDQTFLQGSKTAFDLAFGLRAGSDQMGYPQSGEGALELRTRITIISHGIMPKEAKAVGIYDHGQAVLEKKAAKMLEMIPSGVSGDKDGAEEFAGMIIDG